MTITAANASSINDGAAALVVMSVEKATELNLNTICKIVAQTSAANEPLYFTTAPAKAITKVLDKTGHTINLEEPDLFNQFLSNFFSQVENNQWKPRDPRSNPNEIVRT